MLWPVRIASIVAALAFCFAIAPLTLAITGGNQYILRLVVIAGLFVTLAVSLNLINGITGQFSIGHAAFYMIGAYVTGYVTVRWFEVQNLPPMAWLFVLLPVGALAAGLAGLLVGLPSLKLKGDYLAIVTLGFGEIVRIITINIQEVGGSYGMSGIAKITPVWLVWLLAITCIAVCRNLLKTAHGLPFLAVREDEVAAAAMGVNTTRIKVLAFVIGSAFAGMAGVLFAHYELFITPENFKMEVSFVILTMVVIGGTGSITGSTIAAIALFGIPEWFRELEDAERNSLTLSGNALIAGMLATIVAIAAMRWVRDSYHAEQVKKVGAYVAAFLLWFVAQFVFSYLLGFLPAIASQIYEVKELRMVIFAGSLIIVMLLRPQGVFAHNEFSWDWVKSLFGRKREAPA